MTQADEPLIHNFSSFEAREAAFGARVHGLIPQRHAGVQAFWQELRAITAELLPLAIERPAAAITSNPGDCLAFGTAFQVLAAASMNNRGKGPGAAGVAERFNLAERIHQPIRTLSGGETVRLAMAKAYLAAEYCPWLAVASPFSWLSCENRPLVDLLFQRWRQAGRPVELFLLDGEEDTQPLAPRRQAGSTVAPLWRIALRGVRIGLDAIANLPGSHAPQARVDDFDAELPSPCLLAGANGEGKSLLARILAGALPCEGRIAMQCAGRAGRSRLLLQDAAAQLLMRSPEALLAQLPHEARSEVESLRAQILAAAGAPPQATDTLLALKALLVALRLQARPVALILDEPDWGLPRRAASGLVLGAIEAAHARGVALVLISHKPWWDAIVASRLTVRKLPAEPGLAFRLALTSPAAGDAP